jgi:hypothetical protein
VVVVAEVAAAAELVQFADPFVASFVQHLHQHQPYLTFQSSAGLRCPLAASESCLKSNSNRILMTPHPERSIYSAIVDIQMTADI